MRRATAVGRVGGAAVLLCAVVLLTLSASLSPAAAQTQPPNATTSTESSSSAAAPAPAPPAFSGGVTPLHKIAAAGFGTTLGAAVLLRTARRLAFPAEHCFAQLSLAHAAPRLVHGWLLPRALLSLSATELLLLLGYAITAALYLQEAHREDTGSVGHIVGQLVPPAFATALLPVTRHSLWLPLLGVPFERAVAAHRAAASAALILVAAHAALMVKELGVPVLTYTAPNSLGDGAVYGTAAATVFAAQALLALPAVRARWWELFKASHMVLFPTGIVLAVMHARLFLPYIVLPLTLWVADAAFRWARAARRLPLVLTALPGGATRMEVSGIRASSAPVGQHAYLQVPALSAVEWHPFSVTSAPGATPGTLTFVVKAKEAGTFTARLAELAAASPARPLTCRLDGCYGAPSIAPLSRYAAVVFVAGGVGITPLAALAEHAAALAASGTGGALASAALVWAAREPAAFDAWLPGLVARLRASALFAAGEVQLCLTGVADKSSGMDLQALSRPSVDEIFNPNKPIVSLARRSLDRVPSLRRRSVDAESSRFERLEEQKDEDELHGNEAGNAPLGATPRGVVFRRPDVLVAITAAVARAAATGAPPSRVAVFACGPKSLTRTAHAAAAAAGCHVHLEAFSA